MAGHFEKALKAHKAGDFATAEKAYKKALRTDPDAFAAQINLSTLYMSSGRMEQANRMLEKLSDAHPDNATVWFNYANSCKGVGKVQEALRAYGEAVRIDPEQVNAWFNLGNTHAETGAYEEAIAAYERALHYDPNEAALLNNYANALKETGRWDDALQVYIRASQRDPGNPELLNNLGYALEKKLNPEEALNCYEAAIRLKPDFPEAFTNMGLTYLNGDDLQAAAACFSHAITLDETFSKAHAHLAFVHMKAGEYAEGWRRYWQRENRETGLYALCNVPVDMQLPNTLVGVRVLLLREQGIGDELFFLRFAPELKRRGAEVAYNASAKLAPLLAASGLVDAVVGDDAITSYRADYRIPIGDLPHLLNLPGPAQTFSPEIAVDPARLERLEATLAEPDLPKIGIAWRAGVGANRREIALEAFVELLQGLPLHVVVMQRDPTEAELHRLRDAFEHLTDLSACHDDMEDLAALLTLLDDYVAVDNTAVHFCGVLGRPCRLLLQRGYDFRWCKDNPQPWYPSVVAYDASDNAKLRQTIRSIRQVFNKSAR